MKSPFQLDRQNQNIESKIVVALERISEAFRVLLWNESKENSLSPIQIQILIFLFYHSDEKCKVSYLANEFNMTKATISDSVKVLLKKRLVEKAKDFSDSRSYRIELTTLGKETAKKSTQFALRIEQPLNKLSEDQKEVMLSGLLGLIHELNQKGVITIQRMCYTCDHYSYSNGVHSCNLLKKQLENRELRIDCADHKMAI